MIIQSIEIISFGKFKNKTIELESGLNVIFGNNESGKSTIISFIQAMLYGFGDNRGKSLSLREKYLPWSGGECEGKLNLISDSGKKITIYRKSGSVKKYDALKIYDTDTAEPLSLKPEDIAGVNSDTFLRTVCIRQLSSAFESGTAEIVTRLSNIADSGDESTSYNKALKILDTARKEIKPLRGSGGSLYEVTSEISKLERAEAAQKETQNKLKSYNAMLPSLKESAKKAEEDYEKALSENYDSLIENLKERISASEESTKKAPSKVSPKKMNFVTSGVCAVLSIAMLILNNGLWFLPLIAAAGIIIFMLLSKETENTPVEESIAESLKKELSVLENKREIHKNNISVLKSKLLAARQRLEEITLLMNTVKSQIEFTDTSELPALYKKREILERDLALITLATDALESSHAKMQKNFTPALNKKASEYFSILTDEKYTKIFCDENFNLSIEADIPRESSFFSGGTIDQLYLSVRLSLIDMIFGDESTFIILDQPFIQYDKERTKKAISLLESLGKSRQTILFTSDEKDFSHNKSTEMLT